jgi:hypothetical protein
MSVAQQLRQEGMQVGMQKDKKQRSGQKYASGQRVHRKDCGLTKKELEKLRS